MVSADRRGAGRADRKRLTMASVKRSAIVLGRRHDVRIFVGARRGPNTNITHQVKRGRAPL